MSRNWTIAGVATVCLITGVALSRVIEPGVRVEKIMLTTKHTRASTFPRNAGSASHCAPRSWKRRLERNVLSFRRGARRRWF
jgi:hypothetical protein